MCKFSKDEDISYEITVNKKRYEAVFYQKSLKYDSLLKEKEMQAKEAELEITIQKKLQAEREQFSETIRKQEQEKTLLKDKDYQLKMLELALAVYF